MLPNFLVIGAGKGGTTSLHHWLAAHPQVFVTPVKETNYFAYRACQLAADACTTPEAHPFFPIRSWEDYVALFRRAGAFVARGEVSPTYLAWPAVAESIAVRLPGVRLIAILRNPVDRAYSSYLMHTRDGRERRSFAEAIRQELDGTTDPTLSYGQRNYLQIGFYDQHLSMYWKQFDAARFHIELYNDLILDPGGLLRRVYEFLGVNENFENNPSSRLNPSGVPSSRLLAPLLRKDRLSRVARVFLPERLRPRAERALDRWRARQLVKPPLDPAFRAELTARYCDDIRRLEQRLGRNLSAWLED